MPQIVRSPDLVLCRVVEPATNKDGAGSIGFCCPSHWTYFRIDVPVFEGPSSTTLCYRVPTLLLRSGRCELGNDVQLFEGLDTLASRD